MNESWNDYDDAEASAENIAEIYNNAGMIPSVLLDKYKKFISNSEFQYVEAFFRKLAELAPDALELFD